MSEPCYFTIAAWGPIQELEAIVHCLVDNLEPDVPADGRGRFLREALIGGRSWVHISSWSHYLDRSRWTNDGAEHHAVFETAVTTMGLEKVVPLLNNSVLVLDGECTWAPPFGFLETISQRFPCVLFEVWSDVPFIREDWWIAIGGDVHPLVVYNGDESCYAKELMCAKNVIDIVGELIPCPFGSHTAW